MKIVLGTIAVVTAIAVALAFLSCSKGDPDARIGGALQEAADQMNQTHGKMVDDDTRLDHVDAGPGKKMTYTFTIVKHQKGDLNLVTLQKVLRTQLISNYKTKEEMKTLREYNVELCYRYKDKDGEFLFETDITPADF